MLKLPAVAFELTSRCNQQCVYCYNSWRDDPASGPAELSTSEICGLIDRVLADAELRRITLTGGEPFMRDDIFEIIEYINGRGLPVAIISNGGRIDAKRAARLKQCRIQYVQVTLGGPDSKRHDAICGEGSYVGTTEAARRLAAEGVAVGGSFLCTRDNFETAEETFERMRELGIDHHYAFNRFNPSGCGSAFMTKLMPTRSEVLEAVDGANRFAAAHEIRVHCTMPIPMCMIDESEYPNVKFGQCAAGSKWGEPAIDPQGNLKLCTLQRGVVGSLYDTSLSSLMESEPAIQFRSAIPDFCRACPHRETCLGGCGATADWIYGSADQLDPFLSQHVPEDVARTSIDVRIDPWYDLVYHTLAYLKIQSGDASTLFSPDYVIESDACYAHGIQSDEANSRTLPSDARLIETFYDESSQPTILHAFPLLHDGIDDFRSSFTPLLKDASWSTDARRRLAGAILARTHVALPDLFQVAMLNELRCGFERYHTERLSTSAETYRSFFTENIQSIAEEMPGLAAMRWVLSVPMGIHGRLLQWSSSGPTIVVGTGCNETLFFPVIQGCHEYFVWQARQIVSVSSENWSSVAGRPGYRDFQALESTALSLGARFFLVSRWEEEYLRWLGQIFKSEPAKETAERFAADAVE